MIILRNNINKAVHKIKRLNSEFQDHTLTQQINSTGSEKSSWALKKLGDSWSDLVILSGNDMYHQRASMVDYIKVKFEHYFCLVFKGYSKQKHALRAIEDSKKNFFL